MSKTYAVDLDGTTAFYSGWHGKKQPIGAPIPKMIDKIKSFIAAGDRVVIFTARAKTLADVAEVKKWLLDNDLGDLEVTNIKKPEYDCMIDDKVIEVVRNTGLTARDLRIESGVDNQIEAVQGHEGEKRKGEVLKVYEPSAAQSY